MIQDRYQKIGQRIREAREGANLSQKDLAEKLGFGSSTAISLIEMGDRRVSVEDLEKIANELHIDIKVLLDQESDKSDLAFALRAQKDLSTTAKKQILDFIEFVKAKDGK